MIQLIQYFVMRHAESVLTVGFLVMLGFFLAWWKVSQDPRVGRLKSILLLAAIVGTFALWIRAFTVFKEAMWI